MKTIYNQATLCNSCSNCPVVTQGEDGKITINDPAFPDQGAFTFKNQAEADTFFANAPAAYEAFKAGKKS